MENYVYKPIYEIGLRPFMKMSCFAHLHSDSHYKLYYDKINMTQYSSINFLKS